MNPDTAPIAEVEARLLGRQYPYPSCLMECIGPSMDAAIADVKRGS